MKNTYINVLLQIILGFLFADLLTGTVHWFEDTYLDYCIDIPFLSQIAKDNEMHHYFPRSILANSHFKNIEFSMYIALVIFIIFFIFAKKTLYKYIYFYAVFFFFSTISNVIHRYSHMRDCELPFLMKLLQKCGIFCSNEFHSVHHEYPTQRYCVNFEYTNYLLEYIHFWRILEYIIFLITGISPHRKQGYNEYKDIHNELHENAKKECPDKPTREDVETLHKKLDSYKNCAI
jgi:ubiquitin-conjugating enzyme E2 variant